MWMVALTPQHLAQPSLNLTLSVIRHVSHTHHTKDIAKRADDSLRNKNRSV